MVRIRLRRVGAKKQPSYRIVVADQRSPRDGRFIETIGHYNPRTEPETVNYDEERALYWLSVGAQPTEAVRRLFNNLGTYGRLERMRGGEALDALVEEALAEAEARTPVNPKTRHEPGVPSKKKKRSTAEAETADDEAAEEAEAEEAVAEATEDEAAEAVEEEATETEAASDASDAEEAEAETEEPEASEEEEADDADAETTDDEESE